jgi:hypothetical protein
MPIARIVFPVYTGPLRGSIDCSSDPSVPMGIAIRTPMTATRNEVLSEILSFFVQTTVPRRPPLSLRNDRYFPCNALKSRDL